jgi:hypothetical protein
MRYRVNGPKVVGEVFDDEVVVVNFDDGTYYSLAQSGRDVWVALEGGSSIEEIVGLLKRRYEAVDGEIDTAVSALIDELLAEGLIAATEEAAASGEERAADDAARSPFAAPVLTRYTDMQELLLLDPIHEVDETGWPQRRPG